MKGRKKILGALAMLLACPLRAQDLPTRIEEPTRKQETVSESERALAEAEKLEGMESGMDVTYDQVLANPDDIELNYRYARAQVRIGNLRSAAATLERILMVQPELPKVRLFYAVVLFRLDNLDDATRELEILKKQKMPASLRAELNDFVAQIRARRRSTHFNTLFGAGMDYDDNRNAAPASGKRLFFGTPIILDSNSTHQQDFAKTMLANVGVDHDLGYQAGHSLFADYSYYRAEQTGQRILNLQNHYAEAGFIYKTRWVDYTVDGEFDHVLLTQTTFMRSRGARLHMDVKKTPRLVFLGETAYTRQEYNRTLIVPNGPDRTGDKIEGTAGFRYVLGPTTSLQLAYSRIMQGAVAKFDEYQRDSYQATCTWLLGHGQFLILAGVANYDRYTAPDPTVSPQLRRDDTYRGRFTYGVPLGFVAKVLSSAVWTFSYEYYDAFSTITNYSYTDNKVSTLLAYKWSH